MLYLYTLDQPERYARLLREALPGETIACWPQEVDAAAVTHAAVWAPPEDFFARFPNLHTVFAMGAGVDKLLQRADVPEHVQVVRLADAGMAAQMTEYCLLGLLHYQRQMDRYAQQQRDRQEHVNRDRPRLPTPFCYLWAKARHKASTRIALSIPTADYSVASCPAPVQIKRPPESAISP